MSNFLKFQKNYKQFFLLNILSSIAKLGMVGEDERKLLNFYKYLGRNDRIVYAGNVMSSLKQINLSRDQEKKGRISRIEDCMKRTSDSVFILGSGPSINDISQHDFEYMSKRDSWGFNFWFVHEFVPRTYFAQVGIARNRNVEIMKAWDRCFRKVADRYGKTDIVLKGGDLFHGHDLTSSQAYQQLVEAGVASISIMPTLLVPKDISQDAYTLLDSLRRFDLMKFGAGVCPPVPQIRSTVGLLVVLAVQMGYKEIVLCGVDGRDRAHFFDHESYMSVFPELQAIADSYKITEHPHTVVENTGLSPLDYLVVFADFCRDNLGVEVKVASDKSYLTGKLPRYSFPEEPASDA